MKYIAALLLFTTAALLAWPYLYVWRLDTALAARDLQSLERLVDLPAVRAQVKSEFKRDVDRTVGDEGGRVVRWLKEGLQMVSDKAIDANIDLQWVMDTLRTRPGDPPTPRPSLIGDIDYAFWESTDTFLIRLGELGTDPVHVRLQRQDQGWRVVAIYGNP